MTVELYEVFKVTILVILVIGLPFILVELYQLLRKANAVLKDAKQISAKAAEISQDEAVTKQFVSDILSSASNEVIRTQVQNTGNLISKGILSLIQRKY